MDLADRIYVLTIAGVVGFVEDGGGPVCIPENDIELMRVSVKEYRVASHVTGDNGCRAKVMHGPLAGRLGTVFPEHHKASRRLFDRCHSTGTRGLRKCRRFGVTELT
jgi:transcription antitermination factor NusG